MSLQTAASLMADFGARTGLTSASPGRRYLWTDAFAVCNWLGLTRTTGDTGHAALALQLIDQVHHTLGRFRPDGPRSGWLSGLGEAQGEIFPTRGGLRIGKPLDERDPGQRPDERLEWDRDGQYFHYLTRWMCALDRASGVTGDARFHRWAVDLADVAHRAFTYRPGDGMPPRMHWKMSIDLTRPLVPSMGQHDPLDGLVTCLELDAGPALAAARADFAAMLEPRALATGDPLGLGGLLVDAWRLHRLASQGTASSLEWLEPVLVAARSGLGQYLADPDHRAPASRRLAFRELGLAIGLRAMDLLAHEIRAGRFRGNARSQAGVERLVDHDDLRAEIESYWRRPEQQQTDAWQEHLDINQVMLATALASEGFLAVPTPR